MTLTEVNQKNWRGLVRWCCDKLWVVTIPVLYMVSQIIKMKKKIFQEIFHHNEHIRADIIPKNGLLPQFSKILNFCAFILAWKMTSFDMQKKMSENSKSRRIVAEDHFFGIMSALVLQKLLMNNKCLYNFFKRRTWHSKM